MVVPGVVRSMEWLRLSEFAGVVISGRSVTWRVLLCRCATPRPECVAGLVRRYVWSGVWMYFGVRLSVSLSAMMSMLFSERNCLRS